MVLVLIVLFAFLTGCSDRDLRVTFVHGSCPADDDDSPDAGPDAAPDASPDQCAPPEPNAPTCWQYEATAERAQACARWQSDPAFSVGYPVTCNAPAAFCCVRASEPDGAAPDVFCCTPEKL